VGFGNQHAGLAAALASPLPPGEFALAAPQVSQSSLQLPGIVDFASVRQYGEAVQANLDSGCRRRDRQNRRRPL
jgi:hypothetical protein